MRPSASQRLPAEQWAQVVRHAPLISMDLIISNPQGQVLLGYRNNRPAQGYWFVPGGVIRKDEYREQAFARMLLDELGLSQQEGAPWAMPTHANTFWQVFEHHYPDNFSGADFSTHYVVLAHRVSLCEELLARCQWPAEQHSAYRWVSVPALLEDPQVHPYVKDYFKDYIVR